ncbi:hypothetical protein SAMN04515647_4360 [Cohaesibacter sp. ES.047]|nr:hypothetical protein SAMN04515647_4360 [Cohaesibacter sp. ES.047]
MKNEDSQDPADHCEKLLLEIKANLEFRCEPNGDLIVYGIIPLKLRKRISTIIGIAI